MPTYRLVEFDRDGRSTSEQFDAPDHREALDRAVSVLEGHRFELWCGDRRIAAGDTPMQRRMDGARSRGA